MSKVFVMRENQLKDLVRKAQTLVGDISLESVKAFEDAYEKCTKTEIPEWTRYIYAEGPGREYISIEIKEEE